MRRCAAMVAPLPIARAKLHAQTGDVNPGNRLPVRLVRQFKNAHLLDISFDSTKLCLYTGRTGESFTWRGGIWTREGTDPGKVPLQVIEVGSWRVSYSVYLRDRVERASFFPDGKSVYAETTSFHTANEFVRQQVVVDLQTGLREENLRHETPKGVSTFYSYALPNRTLLGEALNPRERFYALVRSKLPGYSELQRMDISPREELGTLRGLSVSADRTALAYAVDHSIVCRRTTDFTVIWERPVEPNLRVWKAAISPEGNRVAVAVVNTAYVEQQRDYYIAILDGKDGTLLSKLPVNGDVGIDISPDGRLLAVSQRKKDARPQRIRPTVHVYEVLSRQLVATVSHDPVSTRDGYIWGLLQGRFTPNGKYLITFGDEDTRVWEIG